MKANDAQHPGDGAEVSDLESLRSQAVGALGKMLSDKDPKVRLRAAQIALAATREKKSGVGGDGPDDAAAAAEDALSKRDAKPGGDA